MLGAAACSRLSFNRYTPTVGSEADAGDWR